MYDVFFLVYMLKKDYNCIYTYRVLYVPPHISHKNKYVLIRFWCIIPLYGKFIEKKKVFQ